MWLHFYTVGCMPEQWLCGKCIDVFASILHQPTNPVVLVTDVNNYNEWQMLHPCWGHTPIWVQTNQFCFRPLLLLSLQFFHFSSRAFPPLEGQFAGRIRWQGSPARGEASIALINATLQDNGTFTCSVRNPPDVHGSPNSHTVLTVTPKGKMAQTTAEEVCLHLYVYLFFSRITQKAQNQFAAILMEGWARGEEVV